MLAKRKVSGFFLNQKSALVFLRAVQVRFYGYEVLKCGENTKFRSQLNFVVRILGPGTNCVPTCRNLGEISADRQLTRAG